MISVQALACGLVGWAVSGAPATADGAHRPPATTAAAAPHAAIAAPGFGIAPIRLRLLVPSMFPPPNRGLEAAPIDSISAPHLDA